MTSDSETASWLAAVRAGNAQAAQYLWEKYYARLVHLATRKLQGTSRRVADEEDVALSALHSLCQGMQAGRFPNVNDRDDLWRLLVVITARKAADLANHNARQKRGGGGAGGSGSSGGGCGGDGAAFSSNGRPGGRQCDFDLEQIVGSEPTPEFCCQVGEECDRLLSALGDETLRLIALAKLEGHTNGEIAGQMQVVPRTIERKLALIRQCWAGEELR